MLKDKLKNRDLGSMIVACGIILVGIIGLLVNQFFSGIELFVGLGMLLMGYLSKKPEI